MKKIETSRQTDQEKRGKTKITKIRNIIQISETKGEQSNIINNSMKNRTIWMKLVNSFMDTDYQILPKKK